MKTTNKAYNAANYAFQADEVILVDANVWLFLQPPAAQPTPQWAIAYSRVFARLLTSKAKPIIDALVLSEYLNRYLRLEYNAAWKESHPDFKAFRQSAGGIALAKKAVTDVKHILQLAEPQDTPLSQTDLPSVLDLLDTGTIDINDGVLIESCRLNNWKLLTHDADMILGGIDVLTTNKRLLRQCQ
ncbi:MAG TPA: hypothetical protein VF268_09055 [Gammaproteobacteria bacterium]